MRFVHPKGFRKNKKESSATSSAL